MTSEPEPQLSRKEEKARKQAFSLNVFAGSFALVIASFAVLALFSVLFISTNLTSKIFGPVVAILVALTLTKMGKIIYKKTMAVGRAFFQDALRSDFPDLEGGSKRGVILSLIALTVSSMVVFGGTHYYVATAEILPNKLLYNVIVGSEYDLLQKMSYSIMTISFTGSLAMCISSGYASYVEMKSVVKTHTYCNNCDNDVDIEQAYCSNCGASLDESLETEPGVLNRFL